MEKKLRIAIICMLTSWSFAQNNGDTIAIKGFKFGGPGRDTLIQFPIDQTKYEKILMKYNMRFKNGLVPTQSQSNLSCGEWDYSCNAFIVDSSKIENGPTSAPNYSIANFTGSVSLFANQAAYDYYNFKQQPVTVQFYGTTCKNVCLS